MADPVKGGRYIRDPKSKALAKVNENAAPPAPTEPVETKLTDPETEVAPVATAKKGK